LTTTNSPARPLEGFRPDRALRGNLATRYLGACLIAAAFLVAGRGVNGFFVATTVLVWLTLDRANPFSLRNMFLGYMVIVFGFGVLLLDLPGNDIFPDVFWYTSLFLGGYYVRRPRAPRPARLSPKRLLPSLIPQLHVALVLAAGMNLLLLGLDLLRYGIIGYYRGQALAAKFLTYGQASVGGGVNQILTFLVKFTTLALIVAYVQSCFESDRPLRYRYLVALLVVIPLLALQRADVATGALTLVAIARLERRVKGGPNTVPTLPSRRRTLLPLFLLALVLGTGISLGRLRERSVGVPQSSTSALLMSELTPAQAYSDIKLNITELGHPHGSTIIGPLLLKPIPRALYPNKPINSGAYYMQVVRPAEFAAGFALPTTFFGDMFLSFGYLAAVAAAAVLGWIAAYIDATDTHAQLLRIPVYLVAFMNAYSVLRSPISESLAGVVLSVVAYAVIRRAFRQARSRVWGVQNPELRVGQT